MITLYHGSPFKFDVPDLSRGKSFRDFGIGFYLAENENDSLTIAIKDGYYGYVYTYDVDDDALFSNFNAIEFDGFDENWARFIYNCRMGNDLPGYDVIVGQTAGGHVNDLFSLYRREEKAFEEVYAEMMREITNTRFGIQWCLANDACLDCIELVGIEKITR